MQQPQEKRWQTRIRAFVLSSRFQVVTKCCAYTSLSCVALCMLLTDYSHLALLLLIPILLLSFTGFFTLQPHRFVSQTAFNLMIMLGNILCVTLFQFGAQADAQTHLQQQIIQLENQSNSLNIQQVALQKQYSDLQLQKPFVPPTRNTTQLAARPRFPICIYAVVDYFTGSITAKTPFTAVKRLQERRGPHRLSGIAMFCKSLVWWIWAVLCYLALQACSYTYFRGSAMQDVLSSPYCIGLVIAGLVLMMVERLIGKLTIKQQF